MIGLLAVLSVLAMAASAAMCVRESLELAYLWRDRRGVDGR